MISGCSSSTIDTVKEARLHYDESFTIEQAFENRKICKETNWTEFPDERGRMIVQYECKLQDDGYFKSNRSNKHAGQKRMHEYSIKSSKSSIKTLNKKLTDFSKAIKGFKLLSQEDMDIMTNMKSPKEDRQKITIQYYKISNEYGLGFCESVHPVVPFSIQGCINELEEKFKETNGEIFGEEEKIEGSKEILESKLKVADKEIISSMSELIQFAVNEENDDVQVIYTGIEMEYFNNSKKERSTQQKFVFKAIYENKITSVRAYPTARGR